MRHLLHLNDVVSSLFPSIPSHFVFLLFPSYSFGRKFGFIFNEGLPRLKHLFLRSITIRPALVPAGLLLVRSESIYFNNKNIILYSPDSKKNVLAIYKPCVRIRLYL